MKIKSHNGNAALTLIEVVIIIAVLAILAALILPAFNKAKMRAQRIRCVSYLKQIGLSYRQWALDHTNSFPMATSTNFGGTQEYIATGDVFRHFEILSNELNTPFILKCLTDERKSIRSFATPLGNSNISYFVGIDAQDTYPNMFLAGDRNLTNGTSLSKNRILELTTNHLVGWNGANHRLLGNIGLTDGSVQGFSISRLREALAATGMETNRLAMP